MSKKDHEYIWSYVDISVGLVDRCKAHQRLYTEVVVCLTLYCMHDARKSNRPVLASSCTLNGQSGATLWGSRMFVLNDNVWRSIYMYIYICTMWLSRFYHMWPRYFFFLYRELRGMRWLSFIRKCFVYRVYGEVDDSYVVKNEWRSFLIRVRIVSMTLIIL